MHLGVEELFTTVDDHYNPIVTKGRAGTGLDDGEASSWVANILINGGEIAFTKATKNDLNPDTRLKEAAVRPTRCEVADRIKANKVHAKLTGDAYQVNCSSDVSITTTAQGW